jgi:hypothetical protein
MFWRQACLVKPDATDDLARGSGRFALYSALTRHSHPASGSQAKWTDNSSVANVPLKHESKLTKGTDILYAALFHHSDRRELGRDSSVPPRQLHQRWR